MILASKAEVLGEKPVQVPSGPPQFPPCLAWDQTRASAVRSVSDRCCMLIYWNLPRLTKDNCKIPLPSIEYNSFRRDPSQVPPKSKPSVAVTPAHSLFVLLNEAFVSMSTDLGEMIVWELGIFHLSSYVACS